MANLKEQAIWEVGIYQWETSDPVLGGENGIDNVPPRQLANRTLWLKTELARCISELGTQKADKATTLGGYGISDAFTQSQINILLAGKVNNTVSVTGGIGMKGGGALVSSQSLSIDKATADDLINGSKNKVVTADGAKVEFDKRVPYEGASKSIDLNGQDLLNAPNIKMGNGNNSEYQAIVAGNYKRGKGNGNYVSFHNARFKEGSLSRFAAISTYSEEGSPISSIFADEANAYLQIGSTNYALATLSKFTRSLNIDGGYFAIPASSPSGKPTLIQVGKFATGEIGNGGNGTVTFPVAFQDFCSAVIVGDTGGFTSSSTGTQEGFRVSTKSKTNFGWISEWQGRNAVMDPIYYIAIGV